jgi:osmotically-inducible protein OsmY
MKLLSQRAAIHFERPGRYGSFDRVKAEKGHVTLSGEVSWDLDREAAEHAVRRLSGVVGITNLTTTKPYAVHHLKSA